MRRLLLLFVFSIVLSPVSAQKDKKKDEDRPVLVVLPPVLHSVVITGRDVDTTNPTEVYEKVYPSLPNEAKKRKFQFAITSPKDLDATYLQIAKKARKPTVEYKFDLLKPLAEKLEARYLAIFSVTQLTGYQSDRGINMANGRANIELMVYDREANEYVWQKTQEGKSSKFSPYQKGSLSARMEHALQYAICDALTPFSKGERVKVERPVSNVVATVQKILGDGKRVLLDVGNSQNVGVGDIFKSIESDAEVKIVEVLENGSIAEVATGTPKEKEVFKPK